MDKDKQLRYGMLPDQRLLVTTPVGDPVAMVHRGSLCAGSGTFTITSVNQSQLYPIAWAVERSARRAGAHALRNRKSQPCMRRQDSPPAQKPPVPASTVPPALRIPRFQLGLRGWGREARRHALASPPLEIRGREASSQGEPAGKLGDLLPEDTLAGDGHTAGDKRQSSGSLIDVELAGELNLQSVFELKPGVGVNASPCDDAHRGAVILDLEIAVSATRIRPTEAGDLARNRE